MQNRQKGFSHSLSCWLQVLYAALETLLLCLLMLVAEPNTKAVFVKAGVYTGELDGR